MPLAVSESAGQRVEQRAAVRSALTSLYSCNNVCRYYPQHTPAHKAAADMKELGVKLVSEFSGVSVAQLEAASATAAQPCSAMPAGAGVHDVPSLTHMSALGSDWLAQSLVNSFFPASSFHFTSPAEASLFSLLTSMSQQVRPHPALFPAKCHTHHRTSACFPLQLPPLLPWAKAL